MTDKLKLKDGGEIGDGQAADKQPEDTFNSDIVAFKKANALSMDLALKLSKAAMQHFHDHGNLDRAQAFYDAMHNNWNRRASFLKWMGDHSPVEFKNKVFKKNKGPNAKPFDLEGAFSMPFWDYDPAPEIVTWNEMGLLNKLLKTIDNMIDGERFQPENTTDVDFAKMLKTNLIRLSKGGNTAPATIN